MRPLVLALALLFTTSVANADEQIRQPPMLRDAAKAHFRDGLAFFQSEQFGPAIVEFRAAWNPTTLCTSSLVHLRVSGGWFTGLFRERNWTLLDLSYGSKKDGIV